MTSHDKRKYGPIRSSDKKAGCRFWFLSPLIYDVKIPCEDNKCNLPQIDPLDVQCTYRPLLSIGMLLIEILRRILIPASGCYGFIVHAKEKDEKAPPEKCDLSRKLVRACDLPVYEEEKKCVECSLPKAPDSDSLFTETVKCARQEIWFLMDQARIISRQLETCLIDLKTNSEEGLKFLREENNVVPRVGAIAVGGLTGYVLALRRGFFRKLLYTTTGGTAMAALCYPREAKEYSQEAFKHLKRYVVIGYHFLNGVSRDLTGYQLPPLPNGHLVISDSAHPGSEAVPSSAHLLPPTATPTHIPLPHEDPYEITKNHHHHQSSDKE